MIFKLDQKSGDVLEKRLKSLYCTAKNKVVELKALMTVGQIKVCIIYVYLRVHAVDCTCSTVALDNRCFI